MNIHTLYTESNPTIQSSHNTEPNPPPRLSSPPPPPSLTPTQNTPYANPPPLTNPPYTSAFPNRFVISHSTFSTIATSAPLNKFPFAVPVVVVARNLNVTGPLSATNFRISGERLLLRGARALVWMMLMLWSTTISDVGSDAGGVLRERICISVSSKGRGRVMGTAGQSRRKGG